MPGLFFFGERRQSEAATALWMGWGKSGVALRLPPHSKERLAKQSQCGVRALPPAWERLPQPRSSARMKTTFGLLEAPSSLSDLRSTRFNFRGKIGSERMSPRSGGGSSRFRPRGGLRWESWDRRSHVEAVQVVFSGSFEPHSQVEEALEVIAGGHQGPFEVHFL